MVVSFVATAMLPMHLSVSPFVGSSEQRLWLFELIATFLKQSYLSSSVEIYLHASGSLVASPTFL